MGDKALRSPMPGTVTKVNRKVGDVVKKGESILAMEAMKMELVLKADYNCKVVKVNVK
jgi:biotin carboxyl carrier protein